MHNRAREGYRNLRIGVNRYGMASRRYEFFGTGHDRAVLDVELPCNEGEDKDSFIPVFKYKGIELTPAILAEILGRPEAPLPLLGET